MSSLGEAARPALPGIVDWMMADGNEEHLEACLHIARRFDSAAGELLIPRLGSPDESVVRQACLLAPRLGAAAAPVVPAMIELLDRPECRWMAIECLGKLGAIARPSVGRIAAFIRDPSIGRMALDALRGIGPDAREAAPELVALYRESHDRNLQDRVLATLAGQGNLDPLWNDSKIDAGTIAGGLLRLWTIGRNEAAGELAVAAITKHPAPAVRKAMVDVLPKFAHTGDDRRIREFRSILEGATGEADPGVRESIDRALRELKRIEHAPVDRGFSPW